MQNKEKTFLNKIKSKFLDIFFGESCISCDEAGKIICNKCQLEIKNQKIINTNLDTISWIKSSLSYKSEILRKALFLLKYNHTKSVAKSLAEIVYLDFLDFIQKIILDKNKIYKDIIFIPIPISEKRKIERDYNQTELIINEIILQIYEKENIKNIEKSEEEKIDLKNNLYLNILLKNKHTIKFAHTHSHTDRERLIKDAFIINKQNLDPALDFMKDENILKEKIIILIDDITTTGATFYEARNTLINFGFKKENIFAFALAH